MRLLILCLAALVLTVGWDTPDLGWTPKVEDFEVNGLHVLLQSDAGTPIVSAALFFKGGYSSAANPTQITQEYFALNTLLNSGTQTLPNIQFQQAVHRRACSIDMFWDFDLSGLTLGCAREEFDSSWALFAGLITSPNFDSTALDRVRAKIRILSDDRRGEPEYYLHYIADSLYYHDHPYGWSDHVGMDDLTPFDLTLAFQDMTMKSRMLLVVVGNVSREEITRKLQGSLAKLPLGNFTPRDFGYPLRSASEGKMLIPYGRPLRNCYIRGYFKIPNRTQFDRLAWDWLRYYLIGEIRRELPPGTACDLVSRDSRASIGVINVTTHDPTLAIETINKVMEDAKRWHFDEATLHHAAMRRMVNYYMYLQSSTSEAAGLGEAECLAQSWRDAFPSYYHLTTATTADIRHAAVGYLDHLNWYILADSATLVNQHLLGK